MISRSEPGDEPTGEEAAAPLPLTIGVAGRRQRRWPAVWFVLAAVILLSLPLTGLALLIQVPSLVGLPLSMLVAVVPAAVYAAIVNMVDTREKEPLALRIGAFLWGAGVAAFIAVVINTVFGLTASRVAGSTVGTFSADILEGPLVEETIKGSGLLILFLLMRDQFDGVLDGILYGALIGLGFAMSENMLYFGSAYLDGGLLALGQTFLVRSVYGGLGHAAFTATTGAGLGYARELGRRPLALLWGVGGFGGAVFQHAAWNLLAGTIVPSLLEADPRATETLYLFLIAPLVAIVLIGPGVVGLLVVAYFGQRREARLISNQLRDEVRAGVITLDEFRTLPSTRRRLGNRLAVLFREGFGAWRLLGQLYQTETELAFRNWHAEMGEAVECQRRYCTPEEYRAAIATLHDQLRDRRAA